jgi:hypothetical protein
MLFPPKTMDLISMVNNEFNSHCHQQRAALIVMNILLGENSVNIHYNFVKKL